MTTVTYPALLPQPHYHVVVGSYPRPLSGRIHRDRSRAVWEMQVAAEQFAGRGIELFEGHVASLDEVYLARCGVCAELPGDKPDLFAEWDALQETLRTWCPTWVTEYPNVFCPRHQPSGEVAE
jgi:hypothetical protein